MDLHVMTDTDRIEWLIVGHGKQLAARVQGNEKAGWRVYDCSNGLTVAGRGPTWREAIDDAIAHSPDSASAEPK